jgi:hypothetical protein
VNEGDRPPGPDDLIHELPPGIESLREPRRRPRETPPAQPESAPEAETQPETAAVPAQRRAEPEPEAEGGLSGIYSSVSMRLSEARREGRPLLSALLNVLGVFILFAGTFCLFVRQEVLDSTQLSNTAVSVVHQDAVKRFIAAKAANEALKRAPQLAGTPAVPVLQSAASSVVGSREFEPVARNAAIAADRALLRGGKAEFSMQLDHFGALLGEQLSPFAPQLAGQIPPFDENVATFQPSDSLPQVVRAVDGIEFLGLILPPISIIVLALGVFFARDRLRGAAGLGLCALLSGVAGFALLAIARGRVLDLASPGLDREAAGATWDQVLGPLRTWYIAEAVAGVALGLAMLAISRRRAA